MRTQSFPKARSSDLIVEDHNEELLVYDRRSDVAHCLTRVAALVWRSCDGQTELEGLVRIVGALDFDGDAEDLTLRALAELAEKGLLEDTYSAGEGVSRRRVLKRMAGASMAAIAAPLVVSAAVPTAQAALSPACRTATQTCTSATNNQPGDCCTGTGLVCTTGTAGSGAQKYCNTSQNCVGAGQNALGTSGSIPCSSGTLTPPNGAASCCSGTCRLSGNNNQLRECV